MNYKDENSFLYARNKNIKRVLNKAIFKLVQSYVKPNGYIGSGCLSWSNWNGIILHHTPLEDGEAAARLLSYYAIPNNHPIIKNFIVAIRNENVLRAEFSYIPPEIPRFENRFVGLNSGNSWRFSTQCRQC